MAVLLQTSLGEYTVDLFVEEVPVLCSNFLKLCKIKHYNNTCIYSIEKNFIARCGEPARDNGAEKAATDRSFLSVLRQRRKAMYEGICAGTVKAEPFRHDLFHHETGLLKEQHHPKLRHNKRGLLGMANSKKDQIGSMFYITLADNLEYLNDKRSIIGEIVEGDLDIINNELVSDAVSNRPLKDLRILHTLILEDPFPDEPFLEAPSLSLARKPHHKEPESSAARRGSRSIKSQHRNKELDPFCPLTPVPSPPEVDNSVEVSDIGGPIDEIEALERLAKAEAQSRAVALEMLGDLPDSQMAPPDNILFVCKLNPVTESDDLNLIFSRFGEILACDIIRDWKTGDSLCYGFIEFESREACEAAYFKMDNCLIDDRRIHVDFCQSLASQWRAYRKYGNRSGNKRQCL